MIILIGVLFFLFGYCCARYAYKKEIEIERLRFVKLFVSNYCKRLESDISKYDEKITDESSSDVEKAVCACLRSQAIHVHDDMRNLWNDGFEHMLQRAINDRVIDRYTFV